MTGSFPRFVMVLVVAATTSVLNEQNASAQRLLQRLRSRVEARIQSVLPEDESPSRAEENPSSPEPADGSPERDRLGLQPLNPIDGNRGQGPAAATPFSPQGNSVSRGMQPTTSERPSLGIQVLPGRPVQAGGLRVNGLLVQQIDPHSLADEAGLRVGDMIIAVGGRPSPGVEAVAAELQRARIGDVVVLTVARAGRLERLRVPLVPATPELNSVAKPPLPETGDQPNRLRPFPSEAATGEATELSRPQLPFSQRLDRDRSDRRNRLRDEADLNRGDAAAGVMPLQSPLQQNLPQPNPALQNPLNSAAEQTAAMDSGELGLTVEPSPSARGVTVTAVGPGSIADRAGIRKDDRIVSVGGRVLQRRQTLDQALALANDPSRLTLKMVRGGQLVEADLAAAMDPKAASGDSTSDEAPSGSMLGNVGSVLGGFFGGGPAQSKGNQPTAATSEEGNRNPAKDSNNQPKAEALKTPAAERPTESADNDDLSLGDDEPIAPALFEAFRLPAPSRQAESKADPINDAGEQETDEQNTDGRSTDEQGSDEQDSDEPSVDELRQEIKRLQQRLQELEESAETKEATKEPKE